MKTILVAEDENAMREFAACILRERGYAVLEAASGEEALARWEHHATGVDLLLTDLQMPGMNGAQLADILEVRQPGLRTLFTSGCVLRVVEEILQYRRPYCFLAKPYGFATLSKAVADALDPTLPPGNHHLPAHFRVASWLTCARELL